MKQALRNLFAPLLNRLEAGDEPFEYKPSQRTILLVVSCLFSGLAGAVVVVSRDVDAGYLFSAVVFGLIGLTGFVVGFLGNDRAVAKIWGNR